MAIAILGTVSDVRLKTNIVKHKTFDNGLGWYSWDWTEEAKGLGYFLKHKEGFIAQEVKEIYPDTVYEKEEHPEDIDSVVNKLHNEYGFRSRFYGFQLIGVDIFNKWNDFLEALN